MACDGEILLFQRKNHVILTHVFIFTFKIPRMLENASKSNTFSIDDMESIETCWSRSWFSCQANDFQNIFYARNEIYSTKILNHTSKLYSEIYNYDTMLGFCFLSANSWTALHVILLSIHHFDIHIKKRLARILRNLNVSILENKIFCPNTILITVFFFGIEF